MEMAVFAIRLDMDFALGYAVRAAMSYRYRQAARSGATFYNPEWLNFAFPSVMLARPSLARLAATRAATITGPSPRLLSDARALASAHTGSQAGRSGTGQDTDCTSPDPPPPPQTPPAPPTRHPGNRQKRDGDHGGRKLSRLLMLARRPQFRR